MSDRKKHSATYQNKLTKQFEIFCGNAVPIAIGIVSASLEIVQISFDIPIAIGTG